MNKLFVLLITLCTFCKLQAQNQDESNYFGNNEIKLNVLYTLIGLPEVTYERILDEESAIGISIATAIDEDITLKFIASPYYRVYFGKKRAAGFFLEGNVSFLSIEDDLEYDSLLMGTFYKEENKLGYGVGIAVGGKFMTRSNWVAELYTGVGRNFVDSENYQFYPRAGITIGKRF
ncbi:hypothetical protein NBRC110019_22020 [Neptunitalea chrysea]|uniref:DUF3575 domain-containing protein n=1 Tax=Neptunitalea chrysea TaxID=1647581 RepID=A0A9W6B7C8_9FLAO|nr:DUF3575 domain-containing protein [Neptunitalea chrysea]GLB53162.1 hypothetical protein NBRC110019_22020 [Neptunitalea chrysea]